MKKMKRFWMTIVDWYQTSNRHIHAKLGTLIFFGMLLSGLFMGVPICPMLVISSVTTFLVMVAVEIAQKRDGGMFDWSDVLAGMTAPIVTCSVAIIVCLIKLIC